MVPIILTLDYDICGNGSGDAMRDIVQSTTRLLDLCDKHNAKPTIMFEVGEYLAFVRYDEQLKADLGYSPQEQMQRQATNAVLPQPCRIQCPRLLPTGRDTKVLPRLGASDRHPRP